MDLHRFWDGVITSSSNLTRLRNEATALPNRREFQRSQLTELASTGFESWGERESFEIAMKFAYRNRSALSCAAKARQSLVVFDLYCYCLFLRSPASLRSIELDILGSSPETQLNYLGAMKASNWRFSGLTNSPSTLT
jgi:hypothetical protein